MVFVNGLKYACEACIKGHRSSSCAHTDRPLFEIKKKGRPVTQCEHCRQLRKTKQVHVRCNCEGGSEVVRKDLAGKSKRKMPISPHFPEGLSVQSLSPSPAPQMKPKGTTSRAGQHSQAVVVSSPSDCGCKSSGRCSCATPIVKKSDDRLGGSREPSSGAYSAPATPPPFSSLSSCCDGQSKGLHDSQSLAQYNGDINIYPAPLITDLAEIVPQPVASTSYNTNDMYYGSSPTLLTLPTSFSWQSGSGVGMCSCGVMCACPGCYEHSNATILSSESCPYACTTCSQCNGFGFTPSTATQNPPGPLNSDTISPVDIWRQPNLTPAPFPNTPSSSSSPSDRCGGSCKCRTQHLSCECASECCGCCFGCSCSDSGSIGTAAVQEEDTRERLGFAVSGERGSCCSEPKSSERNHLKRTTEEGSDTSKKRRRAGNTHDQG